MKIIKENQGKSSVSILLLYCLSACSGGGGDSASPVEAKNYSFTAPNIGTTRVYSETIVDNSSNTINESFTEKVTASNSDGTYVVLKEDPSNNSTTVNGTKYSIPPETFTLNNSGQELSYLTGAISCTLSPHGAGPTYPITIGTSWSIAYTITCGTAAPLSYQQTGSVVAVESITVPAGTYSALKLQSTITFTDASGTIRNLAITNWRDASTGVSIKQVNTYTYSGTIPTNGYPVSLTVLLQSGTP